MNSVVILRLSCSQGDENEGDQSREEGDPSNDDEGEDRALILVCRSENIRKESKGVSRPFEKRNANMQSKVFTHRRGKDLKQLQACR